MKAITFGALGLATIFTGGAALGVLGAAGAIGGATAGATIATAGMTGLAVGAAGGAIVGGIQKSNENKANKAANELAILKGNLLKPTSNKTEEVSLSEVERRRRAQIVDSKNNMNNLLNGPSSDSSTGPLLKTQLGAGSLLG